MPIVLISFLELYLSTDKSDKSTDIQLITKHAILIWFIITL